MSFLSFFVVSVKARRTFLVAALWFKTTWFWDIKSFTFPQVSELFALGSFTFFYFNSFIFFFCYINQKSNIFFQISRFSSQRLRQVAKFTTGFLLHHHLWGRILLYIMYSATRLHIDRFWLTSDGFPFRPQDGEEAWPISRSFSVVELRIAK